ncbi:MAG: hypothetical protein ACRD8O_01305 [Bryobacteraceae bacterium]
MRFAAVPTLFLFAGISLAQERVNVAAQRDAMKKLDFLAGKWSGEAAVIRGPGEQTKVLQTEDVQFKLDGLVLVVEGTGRNPQTGQIVFNALATISYDDAKGRYRFHSYNDGRQLDTELKVSDKEFEWGYTAGPAAVRFVMRLNEKGEWVETGEVTIGSNPPRRTLEMIVRRQK